MLGGWPAYDTNGNPERAFNVRLQQAGYHTGFVGKFLNEYEWSPGSALPPVVPGWSTFNTVFGSAYDGWDFASTTVADQRLQLVQHPAPPASASNAAQGQRLRRHRHRRPGDGLPRPTRRATRPTSSRSRSTRRTTGRSPSRHYPGDPLFPPMFRDRAGERSCGARSACSKLTVDDLPGYGDHRARQPPAPGEGREGPRLEHRAPRCPAAVAVRDLRDRARMAQSADRLVTRILRIGRSRHLRRAHLRQRLPPRPERHGSRQGDAVRHRRPRAAARHRTGRRAGPAQGGHQQHRPRADLRGARRADARALPQRALAGADPSRSPRWCAGRTPSSSTPSRRSPAATPTRPSAAPSSTGSRPSPRCAAGPRCWRASTSTRGRGGSWGYEFYSYRRNRLREAQQRRHPRAPRRGGGADGQARRLRRVPGEGRPAGVRGVSVAAPVSRR